MNAPMIRDQIPKPDFERRAEEIHLRSFSKELGIALSGRWLEAAKRELARPILTPNMWHLANTLLNSANDVVEQFLKKNGVHARKLESYYATPILPAWRAERSEEARPFLSILNELLTNELGLNTHLPLLNLESRSDLEKFGSSKDLFSCVFWEEMNSIYNRQNGENWSPDSRLKEYLSTQDWSLRPQVALIRSVVADEIYSVRAIPEAAGSWAYYFVHVARGHEQNFLDSVQRKFQLEEFGRVLCSEFEDEFRQRQTYLVGEHYKKRLSQYADYATRHRVYSFNSTNRAESGNTFLNKRLEAAMTDEGSRLALAQHLAALAADQVPAEIKNDKSLEYERLLPVGVVNEAASELLTILIERQLNLSDLFITAQLLTAPDKFNLRAVLVPAKATVAMLGDDAQAFNLFELLFIKNRSLYSRDDSSLVLRSLAIGSSIKFDPNQELDQEACKSVVSSGYRRIQQNLRRSLLKLNSRCGILDLLFRLAGSARDDLTNGLRKYFLCPDDDSTLEQLMAVVIQICERHQQKQAVPDEHEKLLREGIRAEENIVRRIATWVSPKYDPLDNRLFLLFKPFILEIRSLALIGKVIEEKTPTEQKIILERLLREPLERACNLAGYPNEKRVRLLSDLIEKLLLLDLSPDDNWVKRIQAAQSTKAVQTRIELPAQAPATWREDKTPSDTPPEFVKRHYGRWLRADATGLTRPDIFRLDRPLYIALANWLRKNQLPDDCPLPNRTDRLAADAARAQEQIDSLSARDLGRFAGFRRRREEKTKG